MERNVIFQWDLKWKNRNDRVGIMEEKRFPRIG